MSSKWPIISFHRADGEGNAVISPEEPHEGPYWTLIGAGSNEEQNALAEALVAAWNTRSPDQASEEIGSAGADSASRGLTALPEDGPSQSETLAYAQRLATIAASHFGPPLGWKPLDDLYGVLTQIDNALTGLAAPSAVIEADMTRGQIEQWISACNHEPARDVLRHYLRLTASPPTGEPDGLKGASRTDITAGSRQADDAAGETPGQSEGDIGPRWRADQPPPFEGDEDGYPEEEWLEALAAHVMDFNAAAKFLTEGFPAACDGISCCSCVVEDFDEDGDRPGKQITFWTGGWSGAEALIGTMLAQFSIRHFHRRWEAGGLYVFFVPYSLLSSEAPRGVASKWKVGPGNAAVCPGCLLPTPTPPKAEAPKTEGAK